MPISEETETENVDTDEFDDSWNSMQSDVENIEEVVSIIVEKLKTVSSLETS